MKFCSIFFSLLLLAVPVTAFAQDTTNHHHISHDKDATGESALPSIPSAIRAEHTHLHAVLESASREEGPVGEAARHLNSVMAPHFQREEEIALPPLGLLGALASGEFTAEMREILPLTRQLREEMPHMLEEHREIVVALEDLRSAAEKAGRPQYVEFADQLKLHAQHEEQILYPAALLVGNTVESQSQ